MRSFALALAATCAFATSAMAQSVTIRPNDDSRIVIRDGDRRAREDIRMRDWQGGRDRVVIRKRARDIETTGTTCRVTTVRRTNDMGDTVVRKTKTCS